MVLCVRDSGQTASHSCTYLVPINCTIIVDVKHTFILTLTLFQIQDNVTKNFVFMHTLLRRVVLCVRDSAQTASHICNKLYNHCRCETYLSFWPWLYFRSRTTSRKTLFSCILYIRRVVLCVRDSVQTTSHICTYLVPINCTIIVDVQHTFHFDLDFISDPGQGRKNFVFLHTLFKMGGTLCSRLSPNRFTYLHILGANQLYNHCRCVESFRSRTRSQKLFCMLYLNHNDWQLCHFLHVNFTFPLLYP